MVVLPSEIINKRVAYACLDWGLGHLTRSIDVLHELQQAGNDILFCGTASQVDFMKEYFPTMKMHVMQLDQLQFKGDNRFVYEGIRNSWKMYRMLSKCKREIEVIEASFNPDFYLSDHFYPFHHRSKHNIFITHQFHLPEQTPCFVKTMHRKWMRAFQTKWLVDEEMLNLAGQMTRDCPSSVYIGLRSRFSFLKQKSKEHENLSGIVVVLSGPKPYAFQLLEMIPEACRPHVNVISPFKLEDESIFSQVIYSRQEADDAILQAEVVVSRSGYSSLMDLMCVKPKVTLLCPTAGQFEQEYLAKLHQGLFQVAFVKEDFQEQLLKLVEERVS